MNKASPFWKAVLYGTVIFCESIFKYCVQVLASTLSITDFMKVMTPDDGNAINILHILPVHESDSICNDKQGLPMDSVLAGCCSLTFYIFTIPMLHLLLKVRNIGTWKHGNIET